MPTSPEQTDIAQSAHATLTDSFEHVRVHPCVINGQPHIVYPRGLKQQSPSLFLKLSQYYEKQGYALKEDQRTADDKRHRKERRRWAPIVLFTASLLFEGSAFAGLRHQNDFNNPSLIHETTLRIIPKAVANHELEQQMKALDAIGEAADVTLQPGARWIFKTLDSHYQAKSGDPAYIVSDLKQIANYYSLFPEVIALLKPLRDKNWELTYDADNWDTVAIGNMMEVDKAIIHFNTRAAAQLLLNRQCTDNPVCIASPADALLHELLHTYSMLVDTRQFIDEGGMNNVLYPYQNEYAVIDEENKLYASMSRHDDLKRPQRVDHTGRTVFAHCPICIK